MFKSLLLPFLLFGGVKNAIVGDQYVLSVDSSNIKYSKDFVDFESAVDNNYMADMNMGVRTAVMNTTYEPTLSQLMSAEYQGIGDNLYYYYLLNSLNSNGVLWLVVDISISFNNYHFSGTQTNHIVDEYTSFYETLELEYLSFNTPIFFVNSGENDGYYDVIFDDYFETHVLSNQGHRIDIYCCFPITLRRDFTESNINYNDVMLNKINASDESSYIKISFEYTLTQDIIYNVETIDLKDFFYDFLSFPFTFFMTITRFELFGFYINDILFGVVGVFAIIGIVRVILRILANR